MKIDKLKISKNNKIFVNIEDIVIKNTALIGQSGSGKSLTLKAILNLLDNFKVYKQFNFNLSNKDIGFIPQNPFTSLSPLTKIKNNFFIKKDKIIKLLQLVNLDSSVLNKYPVELSGGEIQRIVIAISLSNNPKLLLLDEPTTALDTENKLIFLNLLKELQNVINFNFLFVTHDIYSLKHIADRLYILKDGKIVERGDYKDILNNPKHDYTKLLIKSSFENKDVKKNISIINI